MDRLTGAFNSFAGGNNNNNQQQQYSQDQNQGGYGDQGGYQNQGGYQGQGQGQGQGGYQGQSQGGYQGGYPEENRQSHQGQSSGGAGGFLGGLGFGGGNNNQQQQGGYQGQQQQQGGSSGGFLGGLGDKFNSAAGGGRESEKNEDYLDKGVDFVQERFMGQGPQDNESAIEQAKDEQISDYIRKQYKSTTGGDIPIKDKETRFG